MSEHKPGGQAFVRGAGEMAVHLFAVLAGLILMVAGLAMGVSVVLLPIGVPVGIAGLFLLVWGFHGSSGDVLPSGRQ